MSGRARPRLNDARLAAFVEDALSLRGTANHSESARARSTVVIGARRSWKHVAAS